MASTRRSPGSRAGPHRNEPDFETRRSCPPASGLSRTLLNLRAWSVPGSSLARDRALDIGDLVTADEARRAACRAGVIPAVLDGASVPLDLGRAHRYASPHQVLALRLAHSTCQARGCTVPAAWCDAHHRVPWSRGGRTDLADLALLCGHHHHRVHDPTYEATWHPDGAVTLHRLHRRT